MKLRPSPPHIVSLFERVAPFGPDVTRHKMFGHPTLHAWFERSAAFARTLPPKK